MIKLHGDKLRAISTALLEENDEQSLLKRILITAMDITRSDAGTLYILSDDALAFKVRVTKSLDILQLGDDISLPPVPLNRSSVCACSVIDKKIINIHDVSDCKEYDLGGPKIYDELTGYKTVSMITIPMQSIAGDTIGAMQLINALDDDGNVTSYGRDSELILAALASQAALCISNLND